MQERHAVEQKQGRVGAPALIVAALAVLALYSVSVVALGTPPSAADTAESEPEQVVAVAKELLRTK